MVKLWTEDCLLIDRKSSFLVAIFAWSWLGENRPWPRIDVEWLIDGEKIWIEAASHCDVWYYSSDWKMRSQMNLIEAIFLFISTRTQLLLCWAAHWPLPLGLSFLRNLWATLHSISFLKRVCTLPRDLQVALFLGLRPRNVFITIVKVTLSFRTGIGREGAKAFDTLEGDLMCLVYLHRWREMLKQELPWESARVL